MRAATVEFIRGLHGEPTSITAKVLRWQVSKTLDIVVEDRGEEGRVWVPYREGITPPPFAEYYAPGRGRLSNSYPASTLAEGLPVYCVKISDKGQFVQLKQFLSSLADWSPEAIVKRGGKDEIIAGLDGMARVLSFAKGIPIAGKLVASVEGMAKATMIALDERRDWKRVDRLEAIVKHLSGKIGNEANDATPETIDLFNEVLAKAIEDDDAKKAPIYAAMLAWILKKRPVSGEVRIMATAVQQLSYLEMYLFNWWMYRTDQPLGFPQSRPTQDAFGMNEMNKNILCQRLAAYGLNMANPTAPHANPTHFGRLLRDFCGHPMVDPH